MPITVNWYNDDHTAVLTKFVGVYTWDEVFLSVKQSDALIETVDYSVNLLVDVRQTQHVPPLVPTALYKVSTAKNQKTDRVIVLGAKPFLKSMFSVFRMLHPRAADHYHFIENEAQLDTILAKKIL